MRLRLHSKLHLRERGRDCEDHGAHRRGGVGLVAAAHPNAEDIRDLANGRLLLGGADVVDEL